MSEYRGNPQNAIDKAAAEGLFDNLPLAGKPLRLPSTHDENWWIKQRLADHEFDRDALLPIVVLLRREHDDMEATVGALTSEDAVRDHLTDYNERVSRDRAENPHPRLLAPHVDVEEWVQRWRRERGA